MTERRRYDVQGGTGGRGLVLATRGPLGHETTIAYDRFGLLPVLVTDPAGLTTTATHDERLLQPRTVTDPNGNRSEMAYTPLGLPAATWVRGADGSGDRALPSVTLRYDFLAFAREGQPMSVRTLRRAHHDTDTNVPPAERDATIASVEYSEL